MTPRRGARRWLHRVLRAISVALLLFVGPVSADAAHRIVALAPHIVEILYAIGAGSQVVGAVSFSDYPSEAVHLPRVGGYRGVSVEGAVRLAPTLVIAMDESVTGVSQLEALGIRVEYSYPSSVDGVLEDIVRIGAWVGREPEALRVAAGLRDRLRALRNRRPEPPIRVFYEIWHTPLRTAGGASFISNALELIGAENVFSEIEIDAPRVSPEAVLRAAPQAIIVPGESRDVAEREKAWRVLFEHTPEIIVVEAAHDLLHRPGPRLIDGMEQLQDALVRAAREVGRQ